MPQRIKGVLRAKGNLAQYKYNISYKVFSECTVYILKSTLKDVFISGP